MVYAVIFAGGVGARMRNEDIPKQFIVVEGKPIIIRTLEHFQNHPEVDSIVISCLESWIGILEEDIKKYNITKVKTVVPGGASGHESIHNGLLEVNKTSKPDDVVLICDGVRPILSEKLISDCIQTAKDNETAVPVTPSIDSVLESEDGINCSKSLPRKSMYITQAPQGYTMRKIMWAHDEAERKGLDPISSSELLIELGESVNIFIGDRDNIKVTTPEDLRHLRAYYCLERYENFAKEMYQNDN